MRSEAATFKWASIKIVQNTVVFWPLETAGGSAEIAADEAFSHTI